MKKLQDKEIKKWNFSSFAELTGIIRSGPDDKEIFLLLHGLGERGKRIFRKLLPYLPKNSKVIAPNGPFPIERKREEKIDYAHSWYFYNRYEKEYFINQDLAKFWLKDLLQIENPEELPVTIIGFSQGGYLAPLVGEIIPETKLVIGLSCEFRQALITQKPKFSLVGIHGAEDDIIPQEMAQSELEKLKTDGICVDFYSIPETKHEISAPMGEIIKKVLEEHGKESL